MGVKDLWGVLSPVCEKKSLWELEGTSIAIDLSAWICDSNSICSPQINMYLRNLFFRTSYLLLLGVKPVFVLEGEAPELKVDAIRKRLQARGADKPVKETDVTKACSRRRLKGLQKQCVELLSYMGIECLTARGEAEALCAHLNANGVVTGVITQDSDAFLYGAKEVYRNFQLAPHYTCDAYRAEVIQKKLNLSRTKLIGFSILSGSDYNEGVNKLGKATIVKFLSSLQDKQVFQKFLEWRNGCYFDRVADNKFVTSDMRLECSIRDKALKDDGFPYLEVIAEFTADPERPSFHYKWSKPNLPRFVAFAVKKLAWEDEYAAKKFLPVLGRWHLMNGGHPCDFSIVSIVGNGQGKNANKYRVAWDQYDLVTAEPKEMVAQCYSHLVEAFEESRNKKRKPKATGTGRGRKKKAVEPSEPPSSDNQTTLTQILVKQLPEAPPEPESMTNEFNDLEFDDHVFPNHLIDSSEPVFRMNELKKSSSTRESEHRKVMIDWSATYQSI
uniref:Flap endonuclease GEN 1 n=1 Tax=Lygus hesperus TaxID=30085 RepID=A0A0A9WGB9_LYGHE